MRPELIRELEVNDSHIVNLDESGDHTMTVSLIDANHCPGSVMFLFQGYFGTILYTGDFRYSHTMFVDTPLSSSLEIDVLYLDNSYCEPRCKFPSREDATQRIFEVIAAHPDHQILLAMRNLGKENMMINIAMHFQTWIVVPSQVYEVLKVLEAPNVFTTDPKEGYIHVVKFHEIKKELLQKLNKDHPTIAILPTALFTGIDGTPYVNQPNIKLIPYSDHSSYQELHKFVSQIKPKCVVPIVKSQKGVFATDVSERSNMKCFGLYLNRKPRERFIVPESVQIYMKCAPPVQVSMLKNNGVKRKRLMPRRPMKRLPPQKGVVFSPVKSSQESNLSQNKTRTDYNDKPGCQQKLKDGLKHFRNEKGNICDVCGVQCDDPICPNTVHHLCEHHVDQEDCANGKCDVKSKERGDKIQGSETMCHVPDTDSVKGRNDRNDPTVVSRVSLSVGEKVDVSDDRPSSDDIIMVESSPSQEYHGHHDVDSDETIGETDGVGGTNHDMDVCEMVDEMKDGIGEVAMMDSDQTFDEAYGVSDVIHDGDVGKTVCEMERGLGEGTMIGNDGCDQMMVDHSLKVMMVSDDSSIKVNTVDGQVMIDNDEPKKVRESPTVICHDTPEGSMDNRILHLNVYSGEIKPTIEKCDSHKSVWQNQTQTFTQLTGKKAKNITKTEKEKLTLGESLGLSQICGKSKKRKRRKIVHSKLTMREYMNKIYSDGEEDSDNEERQVESGETLNTKVGRLTQASISPYLLTLSKDEITKNKNANMFEYKNNDRKEICKIQNEIKVNIEGAQLMEAAHSDEVEKLEMKVAQNIDQSHCTESQKSMELVDKTDEEKVSTKKDSQVIDCQHRFGESLRKNREDLDMCGKATENGHNVINMDSTFECKLETTDSSLSIIDTSTAVDKGSSRKAIDKPKKSVCRRSSLSVKIKSKYMSPLEKRKAFYRTLEMFTSF